MFLIFSRTVAINLVLSLAVVIFGSIGHAAEKCHESSLGEVGFICIEHGVGAFSAEDRSLAITERVKRLSKDPTFDPDKFALTEQEKTTDIMAADQVVASIRDEDVPKGAESRRSFAETVVGKIKTAISEDRKNRSPQELIKGISYSLAATLGLIVFLILLAKLFKKLYLVIQQSAERFLPTLKINTYELLNSRRVSEFLVWVAQALRFLITLMAFYIYIPLVLSFFPATANLSPKIYGYVADPITNMGRVAVDFIPKLFFLVILVFLTRYLLRVVRFFFLEIQNESIRIDGFYKEWADPTYKLIRLLILAFAIVIAFPYIPGSTSPAFQGISVFLGVLVSLGSSSAIGNIVAGVVITYMRPFQIGDRVKIADTVGDVIEKNLLVTKILTIKNVDITIPNSMVLSSHILNYSTMAKDKGLIVHTSVTIGYDSPWAQIHSLLLEAALKTDLICKEPKPFVLQTSLDDFYVSYQINAFTKAANSIARIESDLHQNIQNAFNAANVEIMSPHYASLRDGNEVTVPTKNRGADYSAPRFRLDVNDN